MVRVTEIDECFTNHFHYDPVSGSIVQRVMCPDTGTTIQRQMPVRAAMTALRQLSGAIDELVFDKIKE